MRATAKPAPSSQQLFQSKVDTLIDAALTCFQKISKKYFAFHLAFAFLVVCEVVLGGFFFSPLIDSYFMGIAIALIFFTLLLYFILRLYYNEQKPEELTQLCDEFVKACKDFAPFNENTADHYLSVASSCYRMTDHLQKSAPQFYEVPKKLQFLSPLVEKYGLQFHLNDLHQMKELFLLAAIDEHLRLVKSMPTSLDAHAACATAYMALSSHYVDAKNKQQIHSKKRSQELARKHRYTSQRALEEFKILNEYAPSDPWVHEQLALSFHNLQMPKEEIQAYETILQLNPHDGDVIYQLGLCYFKQGDMGKGLKMYEKLKSYDIEKAEALIQQYGS